MSRRVFLPTRKPFFLAEAGAAAGRAENGLPIRSLCDSFVFRSARRLFAIDRSETIKKMFWLRRGCLAVLIFAALGASPPACAWGCKGHEIIALIAESHLDARARSMAYKILTAGPIAPSLSRFCGQTGLDRFADSSTWADDVRSVWPATAAWHFINIPLAARRSSNLARYCPPATGCLLSAIRAQLRILRDPRSAAEARADALRFVIHLVGDLHQPLHAATNDDRGGNCIPVTFFGRAPRETGRDREDFSPNLHEVWDVGIIDEFSHGESPQQVAHHLDQKFRAEIPAWQSQPADFAAWAWETHELAKSIAYGRLPRPIFIRRPRPVRSCADDHHIAFRMLRLHENLGPRYEAVAAPVVEEQLTKAGVRLAALLNSLWP